MEKLEKGHSVPILRSIQTELMESTNNIDCIKRAIEAWVKNWDTPKYGKHLIDIDVQKSNPGKIGAIGGRG